MLTCSCTLLQWKRSRDYKNCYNVWSIFADLGDGSGCNFFVANCNDWKALIFKLLDLTGMAVFIEYLRAEKELFQKLMYFFHFI